MIPVVQAMESIRRVTELQVAFGIGERGAETWKRWLETVDAYAPEEEQAEGYAYPSEEHFKVHMMALGGRVISLNGNGEQADG